MRRCPLLTAGKPRQKEVWTSPRHTLGFRLSQGRDQALNTPPGPPACPLPVFPASREIRKREIIRSRKASSDFQGPPKEGETRPWPRDSRKSWFEARVDRPCPRYPPGLLPCFHVSLEEFLSVLLQDFILGQFLPVPGCGGLLVTRGCFTGCCDSFSS